MTHVFISYVRENGDVIQRLAAELKSRGVIVWLDRNDLDPGMRWRDAIKKAIRGGKFFIACFSKESSRRDRSYMNEEMTIAIDELRARPIERTWFIPVLINETEIPSRAISRVEDLSDIQAVKLSRIGVTA
jgi:TIR domain